MKIDIAILVLLVVLVIAYAYRRTSKGRALEPQDKERDCSLPPGCKDLIDVIRLQPHAVPDPMPVTRRVTLPPVVAVRYLAELLQLSKEDVSALCGYYPERSVPFDEAQKILLKYGIWAEKA